MKALTANLPLRREDYERVQDALDLVEAQAAAAIPVRGAQARAPEISEPRSLTSRRYTNWRLRLQGIEP